MSTMGKFELRDTPPMFMWQFLNFNKSYLTAWFCRMQILYFFYINLHIKYTKTGLIVKSLQGVNDGYCLCLLLIKGAESYINIFTSLFSLLINLLVIFSNYLLKNVTTVKKSWHNFLKLNSIFFVKPTHKKI